MSSKLEKIKSPSDLKSFSNEETKLLAYEIRELIIEVVSTNGGHLAPNLGAVELTLAIQKVFDSPKDKILWDVGHQTYAHKIICGRKDFFKTLRQYKGCSGFPSPEESEHDPFIAGHAGTALSVALAFAVARDKKKSSENVIAVIGDGSLTCGSTLEALNNISSTTNSLIIILNDNKMSISQNVGAISRSLNKLISTQGYNRLKTLARNAVLKLPGVGKQIVKAIGRLEEAIKSVIVPGVFFEELGIRYVGPIDGHDIQAMERTFEAVKNFEKPVIVHLITEKGKGYCHAEKMPEKFHGLSAFDPVSGERIQNGITTESFSSVFGSELCAMAENKEDIVAITAAMKSGTGLANFANKFPERFYDVGIAEEHALIFAAGLAKAGLRPFVAIYATFLQRALDYIYHDICIQNLPVIICVDRAGIVEDGPTHHGIYDLSFLRSLPNISILCPKDACELRKMLNSAYNAKIPCVIRYPRSEAGDFESCPKIEWGKAQILRKGSDISIWGCGREALTAMQVSNLLSKKGISSSVINTRFLKPFDKELLSKEAQKKMIVSIENNAQFGGLRSALLENLSESSIARFIHFSFPDSIIEHGAPEEIRKKHGLTAEQICEKILSYRHKENITAS